MGKGICITTEECTEKGGTASGNCASGFGVCCFTTVTAAGEITNNVTYIQNVGFPTAVLGTAPVTAATRKFTVKGGANICQVRFDFEAATVFQGPTAGACAGDAITVTQTSTTIGNGFTNLCGTLSGQHIYVENDGANPAATLNIATSATALARTWKILVRTIELTALPRHLEVVYNISLVQVGTFCRLIQERRGHSWTIYYIILYSQGSRYVFLHC